MARAPDFTPDRDSKTDKPTPEPLPTPTPPAATKPTPGGAVKVVLTCDHTYLPEDLLSDDWATLPTILYPGKGEDGKRTRLEVHPDLAAALDKSNQAETL